MIHPDILYSKAFSIDLRDVDFKNQLKMSSLFQYFQETANLASEKLGLGLENLVVHFGVTWVLVRMRVDIERLPEWNEEITIQTWPIEPNRFEFDRDFTVLDQRGKTIIRANSTWVIMGMKDRKIRRAESIGNFYPILTKERAIPEKFRRLKASDHLEYAYTKKIGYSDVDINGHLNNTKYIDYIMDCFSVPEHEKYEATSIEVHFSNEALPGEHLLLFKDTSQIGEGKVYIEGQKKGNEQTVFKAEVKISDRPSNDNEMKA